MEKLTILARKRLNQHKLSESTTASHVIYLANQFLWQRFDVDKSEVMAKQLKQGVLMVGAASSVWAQELWGVQDDLLNHLSSKCPPKTVLKIRIGGLN